MSCPIEPDCADPTHFTERSTTVTDFLDRTQEPDDVFAARVAAFDAAPTPPEVLREQVARAMWAEQYDVSFDQLTGEIPPRFRRLADAALAVFRGQQDERVQRDVQVGAIERAVRACAEEQMSAGDWADVLYDCGIRAPGSSDA